MQQPAAEPPHLLASRPAQKAPKPEDLWKHWGSDAPEAPDQQHPRPYSWGPLAQTSGVEVPKLLEGLSMRGPQPEAPEGPTVGHHLEHVHRHPNRERTAAKGPH